MAFLSLPIQRISRYQLLLEVIVISEFHLVLKELLTNLESVNPDYIRFQGFLKIIQEVFHLIRDATATMTPEKPELPNLVPTQTPAKKVSTFAMLTHVTVGNNFCQTSRRRG